MGKDREWETVWKELETKGWSLDPEGDVLEGRHREVSLARSKVADATYRASLWSSMFRHINTSLRYGAAEHCDPNSAQHLAFRQTFDVLDRMEGSAATTWALGIFTEEAIVL